MESVSFEVISKRFSSLVESYYSDDPVIMRSIRLKEDHSVRVSRMSDQIAASLKINSGEILISRVIGLLHDTGRFPQFFKYRTFRDVLSVNHAELGIETLQAGNILDGLNATDKNLIIISIRNHNKIHIDADLDENELLHSRIIRDADKLDIIPIMLSHYRSRSLSDNDSLDLGFKDTSGYNHEIIDRILNSETIPNNMRHNYNDVKLGQLAWLLDLNFPFSYNYALEMDFADKIRAFLPVDARIDEAVNHINIVLISKANA